VKRYVSQLGWPIGVFVVVMVAWHLATKIFEIPAYILPDPLRVLGAGLEKRANLFSAVRVSAATSLSSAASCTPSGPPPSPWRGPATTT